MGLAELRENSVMARLLDAMDRGEDVGHYGRLTFVMVARHFLSEEELLQQLTKDPDCDEEKAQLLVRQVEAHDYNPPKPDRILQWMKQQDFAICDTSEGTGNCNVYKSLKFPAEVYQKIAAYYEHRT